MTWFKREQKMRNEGVSFWTEDNGGEDFTSASWFEDSGC